MVKDAFGEFREEIKKLNGKHPSTEIRDSVVTYYQNEYLPLRFS